MCQAKFSSFLAEMATALRAIRSHQIMPFSGGHALLRQDFLSLRLLYFTYLRDAYTRWIDW
ncbi:hypothetical protein BST63_16155 [Bradyrhizobium canariense]|uniref:Uncharacterized protein n=1 Tax=Bradyrhizobium canariense TaxID=255045 RepID=A0ABX3X4M1_9BRAD|nr:hypothetical protein BST63_16155 [Bradyrhizobium canariense]